MLTANVNGIRNRPFPGLVGKCPFCDSDMIPRCGEIRVHHWAHKSKTECDPWWENETDWHRNWKNEFPLRWQEVIFKDRSTGEKHIADVHTLAGLTVEIQHSQMDEKERLSREAFYKNMVWIVDGSRLDTNRKKILKWRNSLTQIIQGQQHTGLFLTNQAEEIFPTEWLKSPVPVCFDYKGPKVDSSTETQPLFLLYPYVVHGSRLVEPIDRDGLIRSILSERLSVQSVREIINGVSRLRVKTPRR